MTMISFTCRFWNMSKSMLFKISGCSESLWAFKALEGFFTSVDLLVSFKVWNLSKSLVASRMITFIRFFSCVNSEVLLQWRVLCERPSTSWGWTYVEVSDSILTFMLMNMFFHLVFSNIMATLGEWTYS